MKFITIFFILFFISTFARAQSTTTTTTDTGLLGTPDKQAHFVFSGAITVASYGYYRYKGYGSFESVLAAGITSIFFSTIKELTDEELSTSDMKTNSLGVGAGMFTTFWISVIF